MRTLSMIRKNANGKKYNFGQHGLLSCESGEYRQRELNRKLFTAIARNEKENVVDLVVSL